MKESVNPGESAESQRPTRRFSLFGQRAGAFFNREGALQRIVRVRTGKVRDGGIPSQKISDASIAVNRVATPAQGKRYLPQLGEAGDHEGKSSRSDSPGTSVAVFSLGEPFDINERDERFAKIKHLFEAVDLGNRALDDTTFGEVAGMAVTAMRESRRGYDMHQPHKITSATVVSDLMKGLQWEYARGLRGLTSAFQQGRALGQLSILSLSIYGYGIAADRSRNIERTDGDEWNIPEVIRLRGKRIIEEQIEQAKAAGKPIPSTQQTLDAMKEKDLFASLRGDHEKDAQDTILRGLAVGVTGAIINSDTVGLKLLDKRMQNMQDNLQGDQYEKTRGILQGVRDLLQAGTRNVQTMRDYGNQQYEN